MLCSVALRSCTLKFTVVAKRYMSGRSGSYILLLSVCTVFIIVHKHRTDIFMVIFYLFLNPCLHGHRGDFILSTFYLLMSYLDRDQAHLHLLIHINFRNKNVVHLIFNFKLQAHLLLIAM